MLMKKILVFVLLCWLPMMAIAAGTADFNIATYNIRQENDNDKEIGNGWERRSPVESAVCLSTPGTPSEINISEYIARTPSDHFPVILKVKF